MTAHGASPKGQREVKRQIRYGTLRQTWRKQQDIEGVDLVWRVGVRGLAVRLVKAESRDPLIGNCFSHLVHYRPAYRGPRTVTLHHQRNGLVCLHQDGAELWLARRRPSVTLTPTILGHLLRQR